MQQFIAAAAAAVALGIGLGSAPAGSAATSPRPAVLSIDASPLTVAGAGGVVTVRVQVRNARTCTFAGQRRAAVALARVRTVACGSGRATARIAVAANPHRRAANLHFRVTATGVRGGTARSTIAVIQAARSDTGGGSPPVPAPTLSVATTTLPAASVGSSYTAALAANGGAGPYSWSVAAGDLPPGLTLSPTGEIAGIPTAPAPARFTVQVADEGGRSASADLSLVVTGGTIPTLGSLNWSGYVLTGGPFTSVTGTFDVPTISPGPTDTVTAEWVGLDGASEADPQVIQAGVLEEYLSATNSTGVIAWLELYPAPAVAVPVPVAAGDEVTVTISARGTGLWNILLEDDTNGLEYSADESYSGPASSAEWIVEAPTSVATNSVLTLGSFSPVTFTRLGVDPAVGALARLLMFQNGAIVSVPSDWSGNGFTVANGSVTPAAP